MNEVLTDHNAPEYIEIRSIKIKLKTAISCNKVGIEHLSKELALGKSGVEEICEIDLSDNDKFKSFLNYLAKPDCLISEIDLSNSSITHQQSTKLVNAILSNNKSRLIKLNLSNSNLGLKSLIEIAKLTNLTHLDISGNNLTSNEGAHILKLTNLIHLNIRCNYLYGIGVRILEFTKLKYLNIDACCVLSGLAKASIAELKAKGCTVVVSR